MLKRTLQVAFVLLLLVTSGTAVYALSELNGLRAEVASLHQQIITTPEPQDTLWSAGITDEASGNYTEFVGLYPSSTLYDSDGAPSLRFSDLARDDPNKPRDFEIGFYRYGPTWHTENSLIEFWIGSGQPNGGIFSVAGNNAGGGEIQIRNPFDTDSIRLTFRDIERPTITTETGIALHFSAREGLISDNKHMFLQGISVDFQSDYTGQVVSGVWQNGTITVPTSAVELSSIILVTPLSLPPSQWWISRIDAGQSFSITSAAQDETMDFNWLIIGTD